jgi:hypothetical protein
MPNPAMPGSLPLVRTADPRQASRRRGRVIAAMFALALAAGVVGSLTHPGATRPFTGPFSYFPQ